MNIRINQEMNKVFNCKRMEVEKWFVTDNIHMCTEVEHLRILITIILSKNIITYIVFSPTVSNRRKRVDERDFILLC